jgi:hypothetical protein
MAGCGCGGGTPALPLTSADYAARQEAAMGDQPSKFRVVRQGQDDELYATYAAARQAAQQLGGVVRTV